MLKRSHLMNTVISFLRDPGYQNLLGVSIMIVLVGMVFYHYVEGWSWLDSLYFCVITLTTIGYGDLSPQTDIGKVFTIIYIIIGISMVLGFVNTVFEHYRAESVKRFAQNKERLQEKRKRLEADKARK